MTVLWLAFAALGLLGGLAAGALAGRRARRALPFGQAFLVYLGVAAVLSTTLAQSMDALPFALLAAAACGIVPFGAGYWVARRLAGAGRAPGPER